MEIYRQWQELFLKQGAHIADEMRWMDVARITFGKNIKVTVVIDESKNLLGLCYWVFCSRILGKRTIVVGPFGGLGGLVSEIPFQNIIIQEMLELAKENKCALLIRSQIYSGPEESLIPSEFVYLEKEVYAGNLIDKLNKKIRYEIKQSFKKKIQTKKIYQLHDFKEYSDFFARTFRALGTPFPGRQYLKNLSIIYEKDLSFIQLRDENYKLIGLAVLIEISDTLHVLHANINELGEALSAGYRLYFEILLHCQERNIGKVNFGRSINGSNQALFKRKWGSNEKMITFLRTKDAPSSFYYKKISQKSALFIWVWKRTPFQIVKLVGPKISKIIM